jgi:DMSO/TMAO reductase YedYZ molybdopterin-dependent catalytic subunit
VKSYFVGVAVAVATAVAALQAQSPALVVAGDIAAPLSLTLADLKAMPRVTKTVTDEKARTATYGGVLLGEVVRKAGVPMGEALKGEALGTYVLAKAKDGYQVVYTVAELDPMMTDGEVLLADTIDGHPFPDTQGPLRIISPPRQARWTMGSSA